MNVTTLWTKGRWYFLVAVAGIVLGVGLTFLLGSGSLSAELAQTKRSLADAQSLNRLVTSSNLKLQQQLDGATQNIADQQRLIAGNQQVLDAQKRELDAIASTVESAGGDIYSRALAIASGFDKLYAVYHRGSGTSSSP